MSHVLVVGGGLSGCAAANELTKAGCKVSLVEKSDAVGGKVRDYGCKATDKCNNCGLCLTAGLWDKALRNPLADIYTGAVLCDVSGAAGDFSVTLKTRDGHKYIHGITEIVVAVGFSRRTDAHVQIESGAGIMTGLELERLMKDRREGGLFDNSPARVAFIQCFGSRDKKEQAAYCSRVCCGYSTRSAKVLRHLYPDSQISFFYMELQQVAQGDYFTELTSDGMEFIKCRPVDISGGEITFESGKGGRETRSFDLIVLSEGIHPADDAERLAELLNISLDERGFLQPVGDSADTGVYVVGCASGPAKIEEAYADAVNAARRILTVGGNCV